MNNQISRSMFKEGEKVKLTKGLMGFPKGHRFIVVDCVKKPGIVGGHYYKYTVKVISEDEQEQEKPTVYVMPVKYLKRVK